MLFKRFCVLEEKNHKIIQIKIIQILFFTSKSKMIPISNAIEPIQMKSIDLQIQ